ncbi:MAG: alanine--tRNA ligase-related protein [Patescibacteria group bacterium]|jgi:Ser-tRNA(Ala) deacylase AlaX
MDSTKLLYLEDFNLYAGTATVLGIIDEEERKVIYLNQTIFYPQGGGQPYDQGIIENASGKFLVEEVRFVEGIVRHVGSFESGDFKEGEIVQCSIDKTRRVLNSRLHSAGHVVDMAVSALKLNWVPGKGYHFPNGPYVEYEASLEGLDKEKLRTSIEDSCNNFVAENRTTKLLFIPKEKMHEVCHHVPDYLPEGKPARVVMYGDFGVPCGGTHVSNLLSIGHIVIRKIKSQGDTTRVSYDVDR